jgi:hypothetical protein
MTTVNAAIVRGGVLRVGDAVTYDDPSSRTLTAEAACRVASGNILAVTPPHRA